jgi:hypothetical protein
MHGETVKFTCFGLYGGHHQVALTTEIEKNIQISHKTDVEISDTLQYVRTIYKHTQGGCHYPKKR